MLRDPLLGCPRSKGTWVCGGWLRRGLPALLQPGAQHSLTNLIHPSQSTRFPSIPESLERESLERESLEGESLEGESRRPVGWGKGIPLPSFLPSLPLPQPRGLALGLNPWISMLGMGLKSLNSSRPLCAGAGGGERSPGGTGGQPPAPDPPLSVAVGTWKDLRHCRAPKGSASPLLPGWILPEFPAEEGNGGSGVMGVAHPCGGSSGFLGE